MPSVAEHGKLLQFADDTTLICSGPDVDTVREQLTHDLSLLSSYLLQLIIVHKDGRAWNIFRCEPQDTGFTNIKSHFTR